MIGMINYFLILALRKEPEFQMAFKTNLSLSKVFLVAQMVFENPPAMRET